MDRKHTGSTPIAPQLIGCHQTNLQIRDPHQISYRFDVFKTKSMIWPKKKGHCRALERMLLLRHALKLEGISITSVSCLERKRLEPRFDLHSSPK